MKDMLLTLSNEVITLNFDDSIATVRERLSVYKSDYYADRSATLDEYLSYFDLGIELLFEDGILRSIFLYISEESNEYRCFGKECSYLPEVFWKSPSLSKFQEIVISLGFEEMKTGSGLTTKYIQDDLYVVYSKGPDDVMISFGIQSRFKNSFL